MQMLVPRYLEASIDSFTREQEKFRSQMPNTFVGKGFPGFDDHVRRNMEMFERAFQMFMPFQKAEDADEGAVAAPPPAGRDDLEVLKQQMADMQAKLNQLAFPAAGQGEQPQKPRKS